MPRYSRPMLLAVLAGLLVSCSSLTPQQTPDQALRSTPATATRPTSTIPIRPSATAAPGSTPPVTPTATQTIVPSVAALPRSPEAALAPLQPLRNTKIVDRPLRNFQALTDGRTRYKAAVWSRTGEWIAATPQDGPGLDAINTSTGAVISVVSDSYVLEPVWDASPQPCLLLHRTNGAQDQLSRACLPEIDAPQPTVTTDGPLLAPALAGDELVYSQAGQLVRQRLTTDAAPAPIVAGGALVTALSAAEGRAPLLAWTPLVTDLETVQTLVTSLDRPAPHALSQPGEGLWLPRWSPDGRALVLTSVTGRLVSTTASGDARYDLGPGDLPAWSPDGTRIAYGGANAGTEYISRDIHLVDWQGNGPRLRLTHASEIQLFVSPSWSPDGRRIACVEIDSGRIMIGELP